MKNNVIYSFLDRHQISVIGISLGLLLFSASLTPSLIPRSAVMQATLGGVVIATGYFLSVVLLGFWRFLELPVFHGGLRRIVVSGFF